MPQSLVAVYTHVVFSTKDRIPAFSNKEIRTALHAYVGGTSKALGCAPLVVGGAEDHVHALIRLGSQVEVASFIRELKKSSNGWCRRQMPTMSDFAWQAGYGAFSVGYRELETVIHYIEHQEEHHHKETFVDEYIRLLVENGVDYDQRYCLE